MTNPTAKHQEAAREPERIRVVIRQGKDDWIGIAYSSSAGDPDAIHEYVPVSDLSARDTEIREVLEGLRIQGGGSCWCPDGQLMNHSPACLAAKVLWERVRGGQASSGP